MASAAPTFSRTTTAEEVVSAYADRVKGKTFLVTGASPTSIGSATVYALATAHPAALILVGRSAEKLRPVVDRIHEIDGKVQVHIAEGDLSSIASIRKAAEDILANDQIKSIDAVINNAGVMGGSYRTSVDGIEMQFAACHIGHFLLTNLLLPRLRASAEGGRIVSVGSSGHRYAELAPRFDPLLEHGTPYDEWHSYGFAKVSNTLFAKSLADKGYQAYSLHPGSIITNLHTGTTPGGIDAAVKIIASMGTFTEMGDDPMAVKTQSQGASTQLVAALAPTGTFPNGSYLSDCAVHVPSVQAQDLDGTLRKELWALSERVVGQKFDL